MATTRDKRLTLREFLALPETDPASEYIDGRVVQKLSPKTKHGLIQLELGSMLRRVLVPAFRPLTETRCTFAGRSLVPDLILFRVERIPRDSSGEAANDILDSPDLAVEIVSPEQRVGDLVEKLTFCVKNGVRLGWLIDPETKKVTVFRSGQPPQELPPDGVLEDSDVLPGFRLPIAEMFGWLKLPKEKP